MATKNTALRNLLADAYGNVMNSGKLVFKEGTTTIVTITLPADAFTVAANGSISLTAPVSAAATAATSGPSATLTGELSSSDNTYQITGLTVGTSGSDIVIQNKSINVGQQVTVTNLTWTELATTS